VFRLQGDDELQEAEKRYLPAVRDALSAIVLAAGEGENFAGLTASVPKAMLKVRGRPILERLIDDLAHFGCRDVTVVRGHRAEALALVGVRLVDNLNFADTDEAHSLALAETEIRPSTIVAFGDIVLKRQLLQALLEDAGDGMTIIVDSALAGTDQPDRVRCDQADTGRFRLDPVRLQAAGPAVAVPDSHGAWIGLMHVGREGADWLLAAIAAARARGTLARERMHDLMLAVVAAGHPVRVVYVRGGWVNVNNIADLVDASGL
jgi:phosphoenolpyruvate phosphomutase